ncbi:MAG: DUF1553 domain-containing protein [Verrucomicrobia bacterium]|nr:DUF1553 domain-containing protein [Verrucomicrobiota bacterium]
MLIAPLEAFAQTSSLDFFEKQIRPLLIEKCYECHFREQKGGLRLDSRGSLLVGGDSGPSIVPGAPDASLLIKAITRQHSDLKMPPKTPLSESEQRALIQWVQMGAAWPEPIANNAPKHGNPFITDADRRFWSFQPIKNPLPPTVDSVVEGLNPIDTFLGRSHRESQLTPLPRATERTLIRRAYFDLIGLPPTPTEVTDFVNESSTRAFNQLIDQLLASPQYGERWGGHWLDLTRYADTAGDAADFPVPEAFRYRNYVIDSFNTDKPFNAFVREQIAGDLLPYVNDEQHWEQTIATGYIATSRRIGVSPQNLKHITIEDTLDNLGKTFLGLTIGCARCHDHKFDPIPTADYYSLYGIFDSSVYPHAGAEHQPYRKNFVYRIGNERKTAVLAPYQEQLLPWDKREREALKIYRDFQRMKIDTPGLTRQSTWQQLLKIREDRRRVAESFPELEIAYAIQDGTNPNDAHIMAGGAPSKRSQREQVRRGFLAILGGQKLSTSVEGSGRLQLADWIASDHNPLTARVIANRVWHHHFGRGLVSSPSDFGIRGSRPSHPELLDYLASYLIRSGWSIKSLHRHIMASQSYQRQSMDSPSNATIDPENIHLWRFNRQRMTAEQLRDSILFLSGDLDPTPGSEHPFPHRLTYFYRQHEPFTENYQNNKRTVYRLRRRLEKDAFLDLFDGPDGNLHLASRRATTTTLQSLFFMNGTLIDKQSTKLAQRFTSPDFKPERNLGALYQNLFGRDPSPHEAAGLLAKDTVEHTLDWTLLAKAMLSSNEFLFVD